MKKTLGIRHIALKVKNFKDSVLFYTKIIGMEVDWKPDKENIYLTNGEDNLALHYDKNITTTENKQNKLDHFGILVKNKEDIDYWYNIMQENSVEIYQKIKNHRDGSRSFYCYDPDRNILQIIWHPKIN